MQNSTVRGAESPRRPFAKRPKTKASSPFALSFYSPPNSSDEVTETTVLSDSSDQQHVCRSSLGPQQRPQSRRGYNNPILITSSPLLPRHIPFRQLDSPIFIPSSPVYRNIHINEEGITPLQLPPPVSTQHASQFSLNGSTLDIEYRHVNQHDDRNWPVGSVSPYAILEDNEPIQQASSPPYLLSDSPMIWSSHIDIQILHTHTFTQGPQNPNTIDLIDEDLSVPPLPIPNFEMNDPDLTIWADSVFGRDDNDNKDEGMWNRDHARGQRLGDHSGNGVGGCKGYGASFDDGSDADDEGSFGGQF